MSNETELSANTPDQAVIPNVLAEHFPGNFNDPYKALQCGKCRSIPDHCRTVREIQFESAGTCLELECRVSDCKGRTWYVCCVCHRKCGDSINKAAAHFKTKRHKRQANGDTHVINARTTAGDDTEEASGDLLSNAGASNGDQEANSLENLLTGDESVQSWPHQESPGKRDFCQAFGNRTIHPVKRTAADDTDLKGEQSALNHIAPDLALFGDTNPAQKDDWIAKLHHNKPKATADDISKALGSDSNMAFFFSAENGSPDGKVGGGLRTWIARAFKGTQALMTEDLPDYREAVFQTRLMIQYTSMNEVQRKRQMDILDGLRISQSSQDPTVSTSGLLKSTCLLSSKSDLRRVFDDGNQHSLWNTLPIPLIKNIGDIAYVSPLHALKFAFAFGFQMDPISVRKESQEADLMQAQNKPTYHVSDCQEVQRMKRGVMEVFKTSDTEFGVVVIVPCSDWRDGHGISHVKNNRSSVTTWSFTISPPKEDVNSTHNTLPIAIGAKKSEFWAETEHQFVKDLKELGDAESPIQLYHGPARKMVWVHVKRLAGMYDKVERADVTHTLAHGGLMHRRFGHLIKFETPPTNAEEVKTYLQNPNRNKCWWGWSLQEKFFQLPRSSTEPNGMKLPACATCRACGLYKILGSEMPGVDDTLGSEFTKCAHCADWTINGDTAGKLRFAAHDDYPKRCSEEPGAPPPPNGRHVPLPTAKSSDLQHDITVMEFQPLKFAQTKMACRFAFFNITRNASKERWTKAQLGAYLKASGVNGQDVDKLWDLAVEVRREGKQDDDVYYADPKGIGSFRFPAAWMIDDFEPTAYIELVMHILFLGVAKSNFLLISILLKKEKLDTQFKKNAQDLLTYLQRFGLGWLVTFPFSKTGLTPGAWVSENWLAWTRLSKIVYYYYEEKMEDGSTDDVLRVVASFLAVVARVMSHSGTTQAGVEELDLLIKEFLSCVRELDIFARYDKMSPQHEKKKKEDQRAKAAATNANKKNDKGNNPSKAKRKKAGEDTEKEDGGTKAWYTMSNYISLLNLTGAIMALGPMVNWWDGGGKGERFIQLIKPLLKRGIRDKNTFMVRVLERFYKLLVLGLFDKMYQVFDNKESPLPKENNGPAQYYLTSDGRMRPVSEKFEVASDTEDDEDDQEDDNMRATLETALEGELLEYSPVEDMNMSKSKTIYIYRNVEEADLAIQEGEPISGIVAHEDPGDESSPMQLYVAFRVKKGTNAHTSVRFGWFKVAFDDRQGENRGGVWYAPIRRALATAKPPLSEEELGEVSKMAAVAVPLRYGLGSMENPSSRKYCVLTNWWKERTKDGKYQIPSLEPTMYKGNNNETLITERLVQRDIHGRVVAQAAI